MIAPLATCLLLAGCSSSDDQPPPGTPHDGGPDVHVQDAQPDTSPPADGGHDAGHDAEDLDAHPDALCVTDADYHPVCGSDGKTYDNAQVATECAHVTVVHDGPCTDGGDGGGDSGGDASDASDQ